MSVRKIINFLLIFVILALILISPWLDGYFLKQNYLNMLAAINADYNMKIQVLDYRMGWFASHAKIYIPSSQSDTTTTEGVTLEQDISHGPYAFDVMQNKRVFALGTIHSDILFPKKAKTMLSNQSNASDLQIDTVVSFLGNYDSQLMTPSFVLMQIPNVIKVTWNGLRGNVISHATGDQLDHIVSNIIIGGGASQGGDAAFSMQDMLFQNDVARHPVGLWKGTSQLTLPSLSYAEGTTPVIALSNLKIGFSTDIDANNNFNFEQLNSVSTFSTPYIVINASSIKIVGNNFNAAAMVDLMREANKTGDVKAEISKLPSIFNVNSTINEDININTSAGKFISTGQIYWPQNINTLKYDQIPDQTNFKFNIRVSVSLVNKVIDSIYYQDTNGTDNTAIKATEPTEEGLLNQIDVWTKEDKITTYISEQLKDLIKTHLPADVFSTNLDPFVARNDISSDIADQIKARYAALYPAQDPKNPTAIPVPPASTPQVAATSTSQQLDADKKKALLNQWIRAGFITLDKDDYVTTITREQGVIKFNNLPAPINDLVSP